MKKLTFILGMLCLMFSATSAFAGGDKEDYQPTIVHDTPVVIRVLKLDSCNCPKKVTAKKTSTISTAKVAETPICKSCTEQPDKDCTLKPLMQPTTLCALENYFDKNCDCNSKQVVLHPLLTQARFIELMEDVSSGVFGSIPQNNADIASMIRQSEEQTVTLKPGEYKLIRIQNCTGALSYDDIPREMNVKALVYRDKPWFVLGTGSVLVAKQDTAKVKVDLPVDEAMAKSKDDKAGSFLGEIWDWITSHLCCLLILLALALLAWWIASRLRKHKEDSDRQHNTLRDDIGVLSKDVKDIKEAQSSESARQNEFREVTNANFAKMQETQKETPKDHFAQTAEEKQQQENILKEIQRTIIVDVNVTVIR